MCRTFALPEIKQGDFALGGQKNSFTNKSSPKNDSGEGTDCEEWMDDDLLEFLNQLPDDFQMFDEANRNASMNVDDNISEVAVSEVSTGQTTQVSAVFDFNGTSANLPSAKTFSHLSFKTPEMVREEKLHALDPFIAAMNEGDLFGLHSMTQSLCEPDVQFYSRSLGFNYGGFTSLFVFWALIFEKHYEGRLSLLQSRINSTIKPRIGFAPDSGVFETADFVMKLEASRLSQFQSFDIFRALMDSGYVHAGLSLPELMALASSFVKDYQQQRLNNTMSMGGNHHLYHVVYIFEFNLRFHAIKHTITHWSMDLLAVEQH